jgi:hypothetical protein
MKNHKQPYHHHGICLSLPAPVRLTSQLQQHPVKCPTYEHTLLCSLIYSIQNMYMDTLSCILIHSTCTLVYSFCTPIYLILSTGIQHKIHWCTISCIYVEYPVYWLQYPAFWWTALCILMYSIRYIDYNIVYIYIHCTECARDWGKPKGTQKQFPANRNQQEVIFPSMTHNLNPYFSSCLQAEWSNLLHRADSKCQWHGSRIYPDE